MSDAAFAAFVRAWLTTTIATTLFASAIALSCVWDTAIYRGLQMAIALGD